MKNSKDVKEKIIACSLIQGAVYLVIFTIILLVMINCSTIICFGYSGSLLNTFRLTQSSLEKLIDGLLGCVGLLILSEILDGGFFQKPHSNGKSNSRNNTGNISNHNQADDQYSEDDIYCPKCGAKMVRRNGKYGPFYGCTNYPRCKGTRNIN